MTNREDGAINWNLPKSRIEGRGAELQDASGLILAKGLAYLRKSAGHGDATFEPSDPAILDTPPKRATSLFLIEGAKALKVVRIEKCPYAPHWHLDLEE